MQPESKCNIHKYTHTVVQTHTQAVAGPVWQREAAQGRWCTWQGSVGGRRWQPCLLASTAREEQRHPRTHNTLHRGGDFQQHTTTLTPLTCRTYQRWTVLEPSYREPTNRTTATLNYGKNCCRVAIQIHWS